MKNNYLSISLEEHENKSFENISEGDALAKLYTLIQDGAIKLKGMPEDFMGKPEHLGLSVVNNELIAGYYIGVDWLKEKELAVYVKPKIDNIDYIQMFCEALQVNTTKKDCDSFAMCYGINFDQPQIEIDTSINLITPLILLHYISLLENLTKRGLKKGYVYREQNLQSKIKGHLLFQKNLRMNTLKKRDDKCFCGFSEYTVNIAENRLLKKALLFTERALSIVLRESKKKLYDDLEVKINQLKSLFVEVSDEIEISEVKNFTYNKLFAGYRDAINVAKMILRRYGYSINNIDTDNNKKTFPFWIDMPRLYEVYVYGVLRENFNDEVKFQVQGYGKTAVDYILTKQKVILDAKYKPCYKDSNAGVLPDIREISGYARDEKILKNFDNPPADIPCIIIYPTLFEEDGNTLDEKEAILSNISENILEKAVKIKAFKNFYKLKIDVPRL